MKLPQIHPREFIVREAQYGLDKLVNDFLAERDNGEKALTPAEMIHVLNEVFSGQIRTFMRYEIRQERHGRTDVPGGLTRDDGDKENDDG